MDQNSKHLTITVNKLIQIWCEPLIRASHTFVRLFNRSLISWLYIHIIVYISSYHKLRECLHIRPIYLSHFTAEFSIKNKSTTLMVILWHWPFTYQSVTPLLPPNTWFPQKPTKLWPPYLGITFGAAQPNLHWLSVTLDVATSGLNGRSKYQSN